MDFFFLIHEFSLFLSNRWFDYTQSVPSDRTNPLMTMQAIHCFIDPTKKKNKKPYILMKHLDTPAR